MKNQFVFLLMIVLSGPVFAQGDFDWWNDIHDWEEGDPGWRTMMKLNPGYLGPNALPIPEVKKGIIKNSSEFEVTASSHFHSGDPTQDISAKVFLPFVDGKIAVEMYGVLAERFAFSEEIRNERVARVRDGKGFAVGDFYFSTLVQISKDRKFPNTLFRFATKTASGNQLEAARYTDSPGYFFDFSFSETWQKVNWAIQPYGLVGFYTWQTNDELNLQNDAFLYAIGADYFTEDWLFSISYSGYSGYKNRRDRPVRVNLDFRRDFGNKAVRIQYHHGLRDWSYKTLRLSLIWEFKPA